MNLIDGYKKNQIVSSEGDVYKLLDISPVWPYTEYNDRTKLAAHIKDVHGNTFTVVYETFRMAFQPTEELFLHVGGRDDIVFDYDADGDLIATFINADSNECKVTIKKKDLGQRRVVTAANVCGDLLLVGARHWSAAMHAQIDAIGRDDHNVSIHDQGFIDQFDVYMSREQAYIVALVADQLNQYREKTFPRDRLFSEDLH